MNKKHRVWGGSIYYKGFMRRCIVCARTKKRALEMMNESGSHAIGPEHFNAFFAITLNLVELQVAKKKEGLWTLMHGPEIPDNYEKIV